MIARRARSHTHRGGAISRRAPRAAMTLLEVILALAILAGSLAVLGELTRQGMHNAEAARAESEAQLLCESKLAEIAAGIAPPEAVTSASWASLRWPSATSADR